VNPGFRRWNFADVFESLDVMFIDAASAVGLLASTHRQAFGLGREHAPRTVMVLEEENCNRAFRLQYLDAYIAPLIQASAGESGHTKPRRHGWRQPFLDQQAQGLFCGAHPLLLSSFPLIRQRNVALAATPRCARGFDQFA
jgi:hypothetical protein